MEIVLGDQNANAKGTHKLLTMIRHILSQWGHRSELAQSSEWGRVRAIIEPPQIKLLFGFWHDSPAILRAEITGVKLYLTDTLGTGTLEDRKWTDQLELDTSLADFFRRPKQSQFEYLEGFILDSIETVLDLVHLS